MQDTINSKHIFLGTKHSLNMVLMITKCINSHKGLNTQRFFKSMHCT